MWNPRRKAACCVGRFWDECIITHFRGGKRQTEEFNLFKQAICGDKQRKLFSDFARTSVDHTW